MSVRRVEGAGRAYLTVSGWLPAPIPPADKKFDFLHEYESIKKNWVIKRRGEAGRLPLPSALR